MSVLIAVGIVAAGTGVGLLSALFGVGGGLVMVPFMTLALGESQHLAEGTSLLVIVPTAVSGVIAHMRREYVSFPHAALLALGGVGGAYLGALAALELEAGTLQTVFGVFLAIMGVRTVVDGYRTRRRELSTDPEG